MRNEIISIALLFLIACNSRQSADQLTNNVTAPDDKLTKDAIDIKRIVKLYSPGDTELVTFQLSDLSFNIHYNNNKPQYLRVDGSVLGKTDSMTHFVKDNKGFYLTLADSNSVKGLGIKYLNGHNGIDISINPSSQALREVRSWQQYSNDGVAYEFSRVKEGKIIAYQYRNGEPVDSFVFQKK